MPHLIKAAPGLVIHLSSGLGRFGVARSTAYCASKFAVEGLNQALADEHPGSELITLAVGPGMVATEMLSAYLEGADLSCYMPPDRVGEGFAELIERAGPAWTGRSLDIEDFLPKAS